MHLERSDWSTTPDFERLVSDQRILLLAASKFGQVLESHPAFAPGIQQVFESSRKLLEQMSKHDPPCSMFQDGSVRGWLASTAVSWSLWWNSQKMLEPMWCMPAEGWELVWTVCTEAERARLFRRKRQPEAARPPSQEGSPELPACPDLRRRLTLGDVDSDGLPEALVDSPVLPAAHPELVRQDAFVEGGGAGRQP